MQINEDIAALYQQASDCLGFNLGKKSGLWQSANHPPFTQRILQRPIAEAIHFIQSSPDIYVNHTARTVESEVIAEELVQCLQLAGFDLDSAPEEIQESYLTRNDQISYYNSRPVSVDFLYRLNIWQRIFAGRGADIPCDVILEIGAGLGTLARTVKLLKPSVRYIIVDLLDTLVLSYSFLRANFPDAACQFVVDAAQLRQIDGSADFTFVPAEVVDEFPQLDVDLVVNTQSLGEMRQDVAEQYIHLIENRLNVKRFYSLNKYLQRERGVKWRDETFVGSYCTPLDPYWEVLRWEFGPKFVNYRIGGDEHQTLELYVQRVDPDSVDEDTLHQRSDELLAEATALPNFRTYRWHQLMMESIRICPRRENVDPYYQFLKASDCREYRYFGRLLASFGVEVEEPYSLPLPKRGPRRLAAGALRRFGSRVQRLSSMIGGTD